MSEADNPRIIELWPESPWEAGDILIRAAMRLEDQEGAGEAVEVAAEILTALSHACNTQQTVDQHMRSAARLVRMIQLEKLK